MGSAAGNSILLTLFTLASVAACLTKPVPWLDIEDFEERLAADPEGGLYLRVTFRIVNNGTGPATDVHVLTDGLNRTPPKANHYGNSTASIPRIPADSSFLVRTNLEAFMSCRATDPEYAACRGGATYITIVARPENGAPIVRQFRVSEYQ